MAELDPKEYGWEDETAEEGDEHKE